MYASQWARTASLTSRVLMVLGRIDSTNMVLLGLGRKSKIAALMVAIEHRLNPPTAPVTDD